MFSKISVLVPTRKRVARLQTMLESFKATESGWAELLFRIDDDDHETADYLRTVPWAFKRAVFQGSRLLGYRSTPQYLSDLIPLAQGDVLMVGNDDMVFESHGWDKKILDEANKYPDGLFNIGVGTLNTDHFPFSVVSRQVVEELGFMYDPRLFWGDIFLRDVMAAFGRTVILQEVKITHDWAGYKPDATFAEAEQFKTTIGTADYWQRHAELVQEAVTRLRGVTV